MVKIFLGLLVFIFGATFIGIEQNLSSDFNLIELIQNDSVLFVQASYKSKGSFGYGFPDIMFTKSDKEIADSLMSWIKRDVGD